MSDLQDGRKKPIFIHSELDDFGLTAPEFRIYCNLARRADNKTSTAFPSIENISKVCQIGDDACRYALRCLVHFKLIKRIDRPGTSALYVLTDKEEWEFSARPKNIRSVRKTPRDFPGGGNSLPLPLGISQGEGNPDEGNPVKPPIIPQGDEGGGGQKPQSTRASKIAAARYRVCQVWGRATTTRWDKKEEDILPSLLDTTEEDWAVLKEYYSHRGEAGYFCRKSLITLLNNWAGEIDKARNHGMEETPQYKLPNL